LCEKAREKIPKECKCPKKPLHLWACNTEEKICENAAEGGNLECLKYAHEIGCQWGDKKVCEFAAAGGHLECLVYHKQIRLLLLLL
jgi:hypothetical protein